MHRCDPRVRVELGQLLGQLSADRSGEPSLELAGEDGSAAVPTRREEGNPYLRGGKARGGEN